MHVLSCDHCGVEVIRKRKPAYPHVYCSKVCSNRANARPGRQNPNWKAWVKLECPICATQFERRPCHVGATWTCCSAECDRKYRQGLTGSARYNFKGPSKVMACEVCGTEKLVRYSLQKRFRACSRRCACILGQRMWPRTSSLEAAMADAFARAGLFPEAQYPVDRATADFAFPDARLIVECDGVYWHSIPEVHARDRRRDGWLRSKGWHVHRLAEADIRADPDACVEQVRYLLWQDL